MNDSLHNNFYKSYHFGEILPDFCCTEISRIKESEVLIKLKYTFSKISGTILLCKTQ